MAQRTTSDSGLALVAWTMPLRVGPSTVVVSTAGAPPLTAHAFSLGFQAKMVFAGTTTSCAIDLADAAWCWGANQYGQVGIGSTTSIVSHPTRVAGGLRFSKLAPGPGTTCGLTLDGHLYCWGINTSGQIDPNVDEGSRPADRGRDESALFTDVAPSDYPSFCGIAVDGKGYCWGDNTIGELGTGYDLPYFGTRPIAMYIDVALERMSNGQCALSVAHAWICWGFIPMTQNGQEIAVEFFLPVVVATVEPFRQISNICGVTISGIVKCRLEGTWVSQSQFGWPDPAPTPMTAPVTDFSGDIDSGCALTAAAALYCWGSNQYGVVGAGDTNDRLSPVEIAAGRFTPTAISKAHNVACALDSRRQVWCWGDNRSGATGGPSLGVVLVPAGVLP